MKQIINFNRKHIEQGPWLLRKAVYCDLEEEAIEIVTILDEKSIYLSDGYGITALHRACEKNMNILILAILEKTKDAENINSVRMGDITAFSQYMESKNPLDKVIEKFIEKKANTTNMKNVHKNKIKKMKKKLSSQDKNAKISE